MRGYTDVYNSFKKSNTSLPPPNCLCFCSVLLPQSPPKKPPITSLSPLWDLLRPPARLPPSSSFPLPASPPLNSPPFRYLKLLLFPPVLPLPPHSPSAPRSPSPSPPPLTQKDKYVVFRYFDYTVNNIVSYNDFFRFYIFD